MPSPNSVSPLLLLSFSLDLGFLSHCLFENLADLRLHSVFATRDPDHDETTKSLPQQFLQSNSAVAAPVPLISTTRAPKIIVAWSPLSPLLLSLLSTSHSSARGYAPPSQPRARPPEMPKFGAATLMLLIHVVGLDARLKRPASLLSKVEHQDMPHGFSQNNRLPKRLYRAARL